jgi:hypothetical protein
MRPGELKLAAGGQTLAGIALAGFSTPYWLECLGLKSVTERGDPGQPLFLGLMWLVGAAHAVLGAMALVRPAAARGLVRFLAGADGVVCVAFGAASLASGAFLGALAFLGLGALLFALAAACRAAPLAN